MRLFDLFRSTREYIANVDCEPLTSAVNIVLVILTVQQLGDVREVLIVGDQDGRP